MKQPESAHWYDPITSEPRHFIEKKDGSGLRPTTLSDAKKNGWVPSVTTILKVLRKPALEEWLIRQAVAAICTAPDIPGEGLDAKITRVLETERQQDQEAQAARDRGTEIHAALEAMFQGQPVEAELVPWVAPVYVALSKRGEVKAVEQVVVGDGYAGKIDLQLHQPDGFLWLYDYKTTKKLPKEPYPEARLQLAAYGVATEQDFQCANVYISTMTPGEFVILEHEHVQETFHEGFMPLLRHWQWSTGFKPLQS